MCFVQKFKSKKLMEERMNNPLIAKKDILVYKKLYLQSNGKKGKSPLRGFLYEKGYTYYITNKQPFHIRIPVYTRFSNTFFINRGLHSYAKRRETTYTNIVEMYIPKGAIYYTNGKQYVSSQLMWI